MVFNLLCETPFIQICNNTHENICDIQMKIIIDFSRKIEFNYLSTNIGLCGNVLTSSFTQGKWMDLGEESIFLVKSDK